MFLTKTGIFGTKVPGDGIAFATAPRQLHAGLVEVKCRQFQFEAGVAVGRVVGDDVGVAVRPRYRPPEHALQVVLVAVVAVVVDVHLARQRHLRVRVLRTVRLQAVDLQLRAPVGGRLHQDLDSLQMNEKEQLKCETIKK